MLWQLSHSLRFQQYFYNSMESRHLDYNLEDLRVEQESIDKLIDSLLGFNPTSSNALLRQRRDSESAASPTPVRGRGPGRPRGTKTSSTRTPSSPSPLVPENSLSAVVECLNKLNVQNKRILNFVEVISENVKSVNATAVQSESPIETSVSSAPQQQAINNVNDRLEKIEQNININTLICRGTAVEDLLKASPSGEPLNLERLKGDICKTACGDSVTGIDIANMRISVFGKDKKCLKINCANSTSKLHLIRQARLRKPEGFYVSEFLTTAKLKVFHNLRALKKQHPTRIKAVFTRGGNVLYTLQNSERVYQASSLSDLESIVGPDSTEETSRTE